jgi:hypothetical protein
MAVVKIMDLFVAGILLQKIVLLVFQAAKENSYSRYCHKKALSSQFVFKDDYCVFYFPEGESVVLLSTMHVDKKLVS